MCEDNQIGIWRIKHDEGKENYHGHRYCYYLFCARSGCKYHSHHNGYYRPRKYDSWDWLILFMHDAVIGKREKQKGCSVV